MAFFCFAVVIVVVVVVVVVEEEEEEEMIHSIVGAITGENDKKKIKGTVVLMKKNVLDFNDFNASVLDRVHELLGQGVSLQLVSAVHGDPGEFFYFILFFFMFLMMGLLKLEERRMIPFCEG